MGFWSLSLNLREPILTANVGGKLIKFLIDIEADVSVVIQLVAPLINKKMIALLSKQINVQGGAGQTFSYSFCKSQQD